MSEYRCERCEKMKPFDASKIGIGSKVNFYVTRQTGEQTFRSTHKEGVVIEANGDELTIKLKRGASTYKRRRDQVTPDGAPNALSYALIGRCECEGA